MLLQKLLRAVITGLGIMLVLSPLAMWLAWSSQILVGIITVTVVGMLALLFCRWLNDDLEQKADRNSERTADIGPIVVSDRFLAELSGMGPWTYHNRLTGDYDFRTKMARLRQLLKANQNSKV